MVFQRPMVTAGVLLGAILGMVLALYMVILDPDTGKVLQENPMSIFIFPLFITMFGLLGGFAVGILASFLPQKKR